MRLIDLARFLSAQPEKIARRLLKDRRGIAAVEFAFVLPIMLTLYLGCVEVTQGVIANRQVTAIARTIADLASQQTGALTDTGNAALGIDVSQIFAASQALFPNATAPIQMTLSAVDFVPVGNCTSNCTYTAQTSWSVTVNGGTTRSCVTLSQVPNGTAPSPNTMPAGIYGAGSVIVADVHYLYNPTFGYVLVNNIPLNYTAYMKPRAQTYITFNPAVASEKCAGLP
jgi:Flp pilus assembly protein TadG